MTDLECYVHEVAYWDGYGDGGLALAGAPTNMYGAQFERLFVDEPKLASVGELVWWWYYVGYDNGFEDGYHDMFLEVVGARV